MRRVILVALLLAVLQLDIDYYYHHLHVDCLEKVGGSKSNWLRVAGFGLTTKVRVIRQDSLKLDEEVTVKEYYSNVERRSNLQLVISKRDNSTNYEQEEHEINYYFKGAGEANTTKQMLKTLKTPNGLDCRQATSQMLADDLFGSMSSIDGHLTGSEWLKDRKDVPDYLIGPARLLMIVDANRNRLEHTIGLGTKTRNQATVRFMLKDSLGARSESEPSQLMVYYGKSQAGLNDLPLKIWFSIREDVDIILDYSQVNLIDYDAAATKAIEGQNLFTFPLDSGCSPHLPLSQLIRHQSAPRLLSFRAKVENLVDNVPELDYFIAYDGYAGVVRRDTSNQAASSYSITIEDLQMQLRYNILQTRSPTTTTTGSDTGETHGASIQCSVGQHLGSKFSMQDPAPVLPFDGMVEMGRSSVRGIEATVYELQTVELPEILFPRVSYRDSKGNNRSAYVPNPTGDQQVFCLNYYFSSDPPGDPTNSLWSDGQPLGQLLRIDVMQQNWPVYRIEVEEFIWQLIDAPNGDRANELFALGDRCHPATGAGQSEKLRAENYANLKMELEYDPTDQRVSLAAREALSIIGGPIKRNRALLQALSRTNSPLRVTQIRDLVSSVRLISDDGIWQVGDSFRLQLEAKLNHHRHKIYRPASVSKGRVRRQSKPIRASNFDECFWEMARRFRPASQMIFSYCYSSCQIDESPVIGSTGGQVKAIESLLFEMGNDDSMPCEIFKLESMVDVDDDDKGIGSTSRYVWSRIQDGLRAKELKLPVTGLERVSELIVTTKTVEIDNIRWSATNGNSMSLNQSAAAADESLILEGIGLRALDPAITRVEARGSTKCDEAKLSPPDMSYSLCHSSCLASLKCKSFSLCANQGRLECLLSELEFRDAEILRDIEQKSANLRVGSKRGSITVQLTSKSNQTFGDDASKTTASSLLIELRVDRRCHLYNRRAIELFNQAGKTADTVLSNRNLVPADSEEQCAELCLSMNLHFFEGLAKTKALFMGEPNPEVDFLNKIRTMEASILRSWCASFAYLDLGAGLLMPDDAKKTLDSSKLTKNGLCHISRSAEDDDNDSEPKMAESKPEVAKPDLKVPLHMYKFIYSSLYEPQQGLRLLSSYQGNPDATLSRLAPVEARKFVDENNDQAYVEAPNLETCARLCFMQTSRVRPWCRSFDFFKYNLAKTDRMRMVPRFYCILNSMTAAEANRSPLRQRIVITPLNMTMLHYEPKDFLSLDNVHLIEWDSNSKWGEATFRLRTMSILFVILGALISSFLLNMILSERVMGRVLPRRESVENPSRSFLNSLIDGNSDVTHRKFEDDIVLPDLSGAPGSNQALAGVS